MNHLSESSLNEYLDERLAPAGRQAAGRHLNECAECRSRLEELRLVFRSLDALTERPLPRDLKPAILARLQDRPRSPFLRILLAVQAGLALGMLALLARLGWILLQPQGQMLFSLSCLPYLVHRLIFHPLIEIHGPKFVGLPLPAPALVGVLLVMLLLLGMGNLKLLKHASRT